MKLEQSILSIFKGKNTASLIKYLLTDNPLTNLSSCMDFLGDAKFYLVLDMTGAFCKLYWKSLVEKNLVLFLALDYTSM